MSRAVAAASVLLVLGCSADETLNIVVPADAAHVATEVMDGSGSVSYSAMREAKSGLLFDTHPADTDGLRILVWRADAFGSATIDDSEPLEPAGPAADTLPIPEFLSVDESGVAQTVISNNRMTAPWWRRRPDPCRSLDAFEYRHGLSILSTVDVSAYDPQRNLVVGVPADAAGTRTSVAFEMGVAIPFPRALTSTVPALDIAWGEGLPWYLLLRDGWVWSMASQADRVTGRQFLGVGRLEESLDASVIHVADDGVVRRLSATDSSLWTTLPGPAVDVAYEGPDELAAIVDGQVMRLRGEQWTSLGSASPQSRLAFIEDALVVTRDFGCDVIFDNGSVETVDFAFQPTDVSRVMNGFAAVGAEAAAVWRPGIGRCVWPMQGVYERVATHRGGFSVNFVAARPNLNGDYFGASIGLSSD